MIAEEEISYCRVAWKLSGKITVDGWNSGKPSNGTEGEKVHICMYQNFQVNKQRDMKAHSIAIPFISFLFFKGGDY